MNSISVCVGCRKGGVGKTAITASLASVFAHKGHSVLVVDLDPQVNVTVALGAIDEEGLPIEPGVVELIKGERVEPVLVHTSASGGRLAVLPASSELDSRQVKSVYPEELLEALLPLREEYDTILLDLPPGSVELERLGIVASNLALVPVDAHPFAITGAQRVCDILIEHREKRRKGPDEWAVVLSKIYRGRKLDQRVQENAPSVFPGTTIFEVKQDAAISYAMANSQPLMEYSPKSPSVEQLYAIKNWVNSKRKAL